MKCVWIAEVEESSIHGYTKKVSLVDGPHDSVAEAKRDLKLFKSITKRTNPLKIVTIHDDD